ncbi:MAG TPA: sigma-70 family RNA polymerase sigma factor [Kineosporiaceae bacterium]|nr:sigma-70 family RNA polymerase sigma factor [Kineosporiaceae bacterium]
MTITATDAVTDAELVLSARQRESGAYAELFRRWYQRSFNVALTILRDREGAADVAQESLLTGWQRLSDLRDPDAFGPWILRTTRNRALNRLSQDSRRRIEPIEEHHECSLLDPDADPALQAERAELNRLIWTAATLLGERDASLLDLHLRHGLQPVQIAEELQITSNNAKQLLFRLRSRLREAISAVLLWRGGHPVCATLATLLAEAGSFDAHVADTIRRHQRGCLQCLSEVSAQTDPERLFASVPFAMTPALVQERAAHALAHAGVPMTPPAATAAAPVVTAPPGMGRIAAIGGAVVTGLAMASAIAIWPTGPSTSPQPTSTPRVGAAPYTAAGPQFTNPALPPTSPPGTAPLLPTSAAVAPTPAAHVVDAGAQGTFCSYSFTVNPDGRGYFTASFTVTNVSPTAWNDWHGTFAVTPAITVINSWGGTFTTSGSSVDITTARYTAHVPSRTSVVVGLAGTTSEATPHVSGFAVEGHICRNAS